MRTCPTLALAALLAAPLAAQKFFPDDPLEHEPAPRDASRAISRKISDYYDFFHMTFATPGEPQPAGGPPIPAGGVNTLGEPMDGAWYTHRHYFRPMSIAELVRGPGNENAPSMEGPWRVVKAKSEGVTPGFEFLDVKGRRYVLKFDPPDYPELATGPDVFVSKFFYALGYHVPQNYVVQFRREQLELAGGVRLVDEKGQVRSMTERDLTEMLNRVPQCDGVYRGGASLYLEGKPLGPFRYYGTRRDDPNDIVPHEHRRELRALRVFCAWMDHDDSRAVNTQDMLVAEGGVSYIRHNLIDFGSTIGSAANGPDSPRANYDYLFAWTPAIRQFVTLGFWVPRWAKARFPDDPAVGRFESKVFDPERWTPEYPNPAFRNMDAGDAFWASKQVMAFTDDEIRAIVATGRYSKRSSEDYIAAALIERRDKIGRAYFSKLLPLDRFAVTGGRLVFADLGALHGFTPARDYVVSWSSFDNRTGGRSPIAGAAGFAVPAEGGAYLAAGIRGPDPAKSVTVYLNRSAGAVRVVGVERTW